MEQNKGVGVIAKATYGVLAGVLLSLTACDKNNNSIGENLLPQYTKMSAHSEVFTMDMATISADMKANASSTATGTSYNNIYVNSTLGYIGEIPNAEFGAIKCEYLTQVYAPRGYKFASEPVEHKVDSAFITIYYQGFSGDSIAPIEVSAYQLKKALPFQKYSISDISEYVSTDNLLGKASYYANRGHGSLANGLKYIRIPFPLDKAQDFYNKSKEGSPVFDSQEAFSQYFPGIYLTTSAGSGSVLRVMDTAISFFFQTEKMLRRKSTGKVDSLGIVTQLEELAHTSEVPQLSRFANSGVEELLQKSSTEPYTYLKAPAGVLTEVTIPTVEIKKSLDKAPAGYERVLNSLHIQFTGEKPNKSLYALNPPQDLLLLPKDSVSNFFERELTELNTPYTAFISNRLTAGSLVYDFGNITSVVIEHIKKHPDTDLVLWLIPVERTQNNERRSPAYGVTTSISNLILPSALKISTKPEDREIKAVFTQRKVGTPF